MAILAQIALHFFPAVGVSGFLEGLRLDTLHGVGTAFLTSHITTELWSLLLHHIGVSVDTAIGCEAESTNALLGDMLVG